MENKDDFIHWISPIFFPMLMTLLGTGLIAITIWDMWISSANNHEMIEYAQEHSTLFIIVGICSGLLFYISQRMVIANYNLETKNKEVKQEAMQSEARHSSQA